ncbi:TPA_asm: hypothetical protein GF078_01240 [Listeria monocytogenes]|nr:hypothetical protein [Listeria monocytogenes]HDQ4411975.1 hypothetical protein [Listeria monocytogenes]
MAKEKVTINSVLNEMTIKSALGMDKRFNPLITVREVQVDGDPGKEVLVYTSKKFEIALLKYKKAKKIDGAIHIADLRKKIQEIYVEENGEKEKINEKMDRFCDQVRNKKEIEYIVTIEILGVKVLDKTTEFGIFTIARGEVMNKLVEEKNSFNINKNGNGQIALDNNKMYISVGVNAKSKNLALELGGKYLREFEQVFRTVLGIDLFQDLGIYNFLGRKTLQHILTWECKGKEFNSHLTFTLDEIDVTDNYFKKERFLKLYSLISNNERNNLEERIYRGVIWIGKSIKELDNNIRISEIVFALESLVQEKNDQIVKTLCGLGSYIYSDEIEMRKEFQEFVKKIYEVRSKIIHGESANTNEILVDESIGKVMTIIFNLLCEEEFSNMKNYDDLKSWYEEKSSAEY